MEQSNLHQYETEVTCTYRNETYSVRDNGAIFRHRKRESRLRPLDEKWTFGRMDIKRGYPYLAGIPVHRIVATAFHGLQPSEKHVVDHIDTNRMNNRADNLRWVTRLDNLLNNPITRRRVEIAYGSIENFFEDPSKPLEGKLDPNFDWMRTVTKKEAEESNKRLLEWAKRDSFPSGEKLGEWIYTPHNEQYISPQEYSDQVESLTPNAVQIKWKTPSEFPLCPSDIGPSALSDYWKSLSEGAVFSRNKFGDSKVHSAELSENLDSLLVMCHNPGGSKEWSLARVTIDGQHFAHESMGTFFSENGALKQFTVARGLEWEGGDSIDDYL